MDCAGPLSYPFLSGPKPCTRPDRVGRSHIQFTRMAARVLRPRRLVPRSGSPNPTAGGAQLVFGLSVARSVDLRIYSSTGATVRTLLVSDLPAGVHDVFWDTKDNAGAPVLADTYVAVLLERDIAAPRPIRIVGPGPPPETIPWGRVHIRVVTP